MKNVRTNDQPLPAFGSAVALLTSWSLNSQYIIFSDELRERTHEQVLFQASSHTQLGQQFYTMQQNKFFERVISRDFWWFYFIVTIGLVHMLFNQLLTQFKLFKPELSFARAFLRGQDWNLENLGDWAKELSPNQTHTHFCLTIFFGDLMAVISTMDHAQHRCFLPRQGEVRSAL